MDLFSNSNLPYTIGFIAIIIIGVILHILLCIYLPAKLAKNRGRSALGWVLLSYIITPFLACILLLIVGNSTEKILRDMQQEKEKEKEQ